MVSQSAESGLNIAQLNRDQLEGILDLQATANYQNSY